LLVTGDPESHAIVTPEIAQQAARLWQNGEVVQVPGAGHSIHRDRYAETMAPIQAFLSRV
jgi:pimeloyl-ACP methyl ester carboxylesterase